MKTKNILATLILAIICVLNQPANAQVIYTDIPDITISNANDVYALDLNNDGTVDFKLSISEHTYNSKHCYTTTVKGTSISASNKNAVLCSYNSYTGSYLPKVMQLFSTIGADTTTWTGGSLIM